jgi:tyrosine-protein phosphatase SIW14
VTKLFFLAALASVAIAADAAQAPGVHNFHEVNEHVYRGAQPTPKGFRNLRKLGIRTVVDLREHHAGEEESVVKSAGMQYLNIGMPRLHAPTDDEVSKALAILNDGADWPVFVHCLRGSDRTGTVIACYRIEHDHWSNGKALDEARADGLSWMERSMRRYVMHFQPSTAATATHP